MKDYDSIFVVEAADTSYTVKAYSKLLAFICRISSRSLSVSTLNIDRQVKYSETENTLVFIL